MPRERRPEPAAPPQEEAALLRPRSGDAKALPRSERNDGGYQETPVTPSTAEADREASDNCALLHRARKETDDSCAPAESSPGAPANAEDQRGPRRERG